jgi:large subunit ribosomal protein L35
MPKMKTKRSAAKRFSVTGSGKLKFRKQGRRHLLASKNRNRKRRLRGNFIANNANLKQLKRILGVGVTSSQD